MCHRICIETVKMAEATVLGFSSFLFHRIVGAIPVAPEESLSNQEMRIVMNKAGRVKQYLRSVRSAVRYRFGLPAKRKLSFVEFIVRKDNTVQFCFNDVHQNRHEATMHMILEALKTIKYTVRKNRRIVFYTSDRPPEDPIRPVLAYSAVEGSRNVISAPDFVFWNWPDVGISDYTQLAEEIMAAGSEEPEDDRLFWIGNVTMHPARRRLLEVAAKDSRILASDVTWVKADRPEGWASDTRMDTQAANYVSLPDHCRYKYLIDVEGIGYSARLKLLFFSGRPVFLQDRPWREFYFDRLEPFVHYIPVAADLSDLTSRLDWAQANPGECRRIAENARNFAMKHLTREAAILYLRNAIRDVLA